MKVVYEHVSFNAAWASSISVSKFIEHEAHHGLSVDQLKEAHALCKAITVQNKSKGKPVK